MENKDYLEQLNEDLEQAGGLTKALDKAAQQGPGEDLEETDQPEQEFVVSEKAREGLDKFMLKRVAIAEITVKELLERGILDPSMPASELVAFLDSMFEKLKKGEQLF